MIGLPDWNYNKILHTSGLFLGGAVAFGRAVMEVDFYKLLTQESPITLVKTGAILFPLVVVIQLAVTEIFRLLEWKDETDLSCVMIRVFALLTSIQLATAASKGLGWTKFYFTGLSTTLVGLEILAGTTCIALGTANIAMNKNFQFPYWLFH